MRKIGLIAVAAGLILAGVAAWATSGTGGGEIVTGKPVIPLALASAAVGIADARPAPVQAYPAQPINIIVPYPPGGNTDIMARALQVEISKSLRQTIIINNKGGASGTLGIRDFVKAEPDGYTLALTPNNPLTAQPHLQKLPYGVDSFRYVCLTYYTPYVLIAAPQAPFKTFDEFVKFARANSEKFGLRHRRSGLHAASRDARCTQGDRRDRPCGAVPGRRPADAGVARRHGDGDHLDAGGGGSGQSAGAGRAVRRTHRHPPRGADHARARLPGRRKLTAGGLIAPAATRDDVIAVLETACAEAASASEYKAIVERLNVTPRYLPGAAFRKLFEAESIRSADEIKRAGLAASR